MYNRQMPSYIKNIIGLSGKARCGKNYIAEEIIRPMGFAPWAYAWALKNGVIGKGLCTYGDVYYRKDPATRQLLQEEGTERGRDVFGKDLWVQTTLAWLEVLSDNWGVQNFVITDCRFENEIKMIHDLGGKVYMIDAPTRVEQSDLDARAKQHRSETQLDGYTEFDGVINNDVGRTDVAEQVISLMLNDGLVDPDTVVDTWGKQNAERLIGGIVG